MSETDVWTLTTWLTGDPPEGFGYGYPSKESAERNGRMFACAVGAQGWRVTSPGGQVVAEWKPSRPPSSSSTASDRRPA